MGVIVAGLGNVLIGDDAFGPYVVRTLAAEYEIPPDVAVHDLGTPGLDLAPFLMDVDAAVVVDTVDADGMPGELRRYAWADLARRPDAPRLTPHEPGLKETVLTLNLLGRAPGDLCVVGVIPGALRTGVGLTPAVAAAVPAAVEAVRRELERLGHPLPRRLDPAEPDLWWERAARRVPGGPGPRRA